MSQVAQIRSSEFSRSETNIRFAHSVYHKSKMNRLLEMMMTDNNNNNNRPIITDSLSDARTESENAIFPFSSTYHR